MSWQGGYRYPQDQVTRHAQPGPGSQRQGHRQFDSQGASPIGMPVAMNPQYSGQGSLIFGLNYKWQNSAN